MPQTSLHGAAPGKRTINVEVNLLAEWLESRGKLRDERMRWMGILAAALIIGAFVTPYLSQRAAESRTKAARAGAAAKARAAALASLSQEKTRVQPGIDSATTLQQSKERSSKLVGEVLEVLNSTSPEMAIESVEAGILGGDLTIKAKAQAETYTAAQSFVSAAGRGAGVKSAMLTAARQSSTLGKDGVAFEFAKKIEVGK